MTPSPPSATLCCGQSGTGKTTYVKQCLQDLGLPVVVVNGGPEYNSFRPKIMTLDDDFKKIVQHAIVLEDFVRTQDKEGRTLIRLLGFLKRHQRCHIFINTYLIRGTGISSFLPLLDFALFTKHPSNRQSLDIFLKTFPLPNVTSESFLSQTARYLLLDLKALKYSLLNDSGQTLPQPSSLPSLAWKSSLISILKGFEDSKLLVAILEFISRNVQLDPLVNHFDFSITLANSKTSHKVSMIDYLLALRSVQKPSSSIKALHAFFLSKFHLPGVFVQNLQLRKLQRREEIK